MTLNYTPLQTAISNASSNTTTSVGNKLNKGTNSTPASFPGGFYHFSAGNLIKTVALPDGATLTHDYREGSIVQVTNTADISNIVLTNVPYAGPSPSVKVLVPFTLIYFPSSTTTAPQITTVNAVAPNFNKINGGGVSDPEQVIVRYHILVPNTGASDVLYSVTSHL